MEEEIKQTKKEEKTVTGVTRAMPVILISIGLFLGLCFLTGDTGIFGRVVSSFMRGLFSYAAYSLPFLTILHGVFYVSDYENKRRLSRLIFSVIFLLTFSSILQVVAYFGVEDQAFSLAAFYKDGQNLHGGGVLGAILCFGVTKVFGTIGLFVLLLTIIALYITFFLTKDKEKTRRFFRALGRYFASAFVPTPKVAREPKKVEKSKAKKNRLSKRNPTEEEKLENLLNDNYVLNGENNLANLEITRLGIRESHTGGIHTESKTNFEKEDASFAQNRADFEPAFSRATAEKKRNADSNKADDVFAGGFRSFDWEVNRATADAALRQEGETGFTEYAARVSETPEQMAKRKREEEFERKKRECLEKMQERTCRQEVCFSSESTTRTSAADVFKETVREPITEEKPPVKTKTQTFVFGEEDKADGIGFSFDFDEEKAPFAKEDDLKMTRSILTPDRDQEEDDEEEKAYEFDKDDMPEEDDVMQTEEIPPEKQNPNIQSSRDYFSFFKDDASDTESEEDGEEEDEDPPFEVDESVPIYEKPLREKISLSDGTSDFQEPDYSGYRYPPMDLLKINCAEQSADIEEENQENADKLIDTLNSFNVPVTIKGYDRGPRITRYELVPAKGVSVKKIVNLFDDITMAIGVKGLRMEAPIPGKTAVGVEIPNSKPTPVFLRDLIEDIQFSQFSSKTVACIGKDVTGYSVYGDIAKMPHLLIAGATGMGKSVCVNSMLISILFRARPDEVKLIIFDPKKVDFQGFNGIPHMLVPVVTDPKQAAGALMWAVDEMERRYEMIEKAHVKKIDDYNAKVKESPELGKSLPRIIIVIDELADLMLQVKNPVEMLIQRIAQKARAAGIHLIIGTQRPQVSVLTGLIKANIPSRISCKVQSNIDSRTVLEISGAEKLLNNGDMLFFPAGAEGPTRVQGAFVSDEEMDAVMEYLRTQAVGDVYDQNVMSEMEKATQKCNKKEESDGFEEEGDEDEGGAVLSDPAFLEAVDIALSAHKISTSLLQRRCRIGYGKASRFIDYMEDLGIVGEANGQKPRDVLMSPEEWSDLLERRSLT